MKKMGVCLVLSCLIPLCGCVGGARGREPENTVLAQVVGVDRMGEVWLLTAAGKDHTGKTVLQRAEGSSLGEAFAALSAAGETWVSVTGVSDFLLGDGVDLKKTLLFILDDSGMSWRASVWYVPIAGAVMEEQETGGGDRLTVLKESGTASRSVLDVLVELEETGATTLPALTTRDGKLTADGKIHYERREKGA